MEYSCKKAKLARKKRNSSFYAMSQKGSISVLEGRRKLVLCMLDDVLKKKRDLLEYVNYIESVKLEND